MERRVGIFSVVVPIYRNEASLPDLLVRLRELHAALGGDLEAVLVVDGSPDRSLALLQEALPTAGFTARLIALSRNFGAFAAVRAGMASGTGDWFGVLAADLQEPPELMLEFHRRLSTGATDIVVGTRDGRSDPLTARTTSRLFWWAYRTLVQRDVPAGGVDVFGCTREVRDQILQLEEHNSTLVGLLYWIGYRRTSVPYARQPRRHGRSAWSLRRKWRYFKDSMFAFSDLPIRLLGGAGLLGMGAAVILSGLVLTARLTGGIDVPGYAATAITVMFFGGLNAFGIGLLGEYIWRVFENTKQRPGFLVADTWDFGARPPQ